MSSLARSSAEKRVTGQIERRLRHVDKEPALLRFAGEIFKTAMADAARQKIREARHNLQRVRPVGVGFANHDTYGPNENWDVMQSLNNISYQDYYNAHRNSPPFVPGLK